MEEALRSLLTSSRVGCSQAEVEALEAQKVHTTWDARPEAERSAHSAAGGPGRASRRNVALARHLWAERQAVAS